MSEPLTDCPHVRWTTTCDDCGEALAVAPTDEPLSDCTEHNHHTRGDHLKPPGRCPACDAIRAATNEPLTDSTCHDCGMTHADGYHPHLHCIIWRAYHRRPTDVLTEHGYVRSLAGFTDDK